LLFLFDNFVLDTDQRELRRDGTAVALQPQVFDLLEYLIRQRDHVVTKDDLISTIWGGRIVSESALATRINAARSAIGDSGDKQRSIKTLPRKGIRFVGSVREAAKPNVALAQPKVEISLAPLPPELTSATPNRSPAERRQLTVVSSELLIGSSRRIDPEDFREIIGAHHRRVAEIAARFSGSVGRSVGKTIPIYFGYPSAHEDDVEQAVNFALALWPAPTR
jgi:DNA-binding winged helix-turn-helix (wHTH) protein